jgi:hypothetical protein
MPVDTQTVPQRPAPNTPAIAQALEERATRGLALYRQHRTEIEDLGDGLYLVPSSDGANLYGVNYAAETCSCPDAARHPELVCKHVFAIGVLNAKRRARKGTCCGCGERQPVRELVEVGEEDLHHDAGERFCEPCARKHSVLS